METIPQRQCQRRYTIGFKSYYVVWKPENAQGKGIVNEV